MRPLEIAVTVALLPYVLHLLSPSRGESMWFGLSLVIAGFLTIGQLLTEGYRWQMLPAYCLVVAFVLLESARWMWAFRAPYVVGVAALFLEFAAIVLSSALPVFKLPASSGPYKIGTQVRHIIDHDRRDPFADKPNAARELMIQIWYPVDPSMQGPVAPYRDRRITTLKDAHFSLAETHSMLGMQIASSQARYPLLIYAPSWTGIRSENTFQVEELASHGYIVVAIDHPYSSRVTVFPDGSIAYRKFAGDEDYSSPAGLAAFIETADRQVEIRARDARFVLDTLERLDAHDPQGLLTGRIDLDRIGIFGFSFGGTTAAETCLLDHRFKAGLNMGGMIAGESAKQGTSAPFFFMFEGLYDNPPYAPGSDLSKLDPAKRREVEFAREQFAEMRRSLAETGGYWMTVRGTRHMDFADSPFFSPLRRGQADPVHTARIISQYVIAFFDKQLKGIEQPLLARSPGEIPEVRFEVWTPKASAALQLGH